MATAIAEPPKPAAATPPPIAAPPPTTEKTPSSVKSRLRGIKDVMGLKTAEKPADAPATPPAPAATPPAPAAAPTKKKGAAKPQPAAVQIDEEKLGQAIARGMQPPTPPPATPPDKKDESQLSPVNKRRLQVLERMVKNNPALAELPTKFLGAIKSEADYRKQWEAENKGKKFDSSDPAHEEFFKGNDVDWDADEYELAREAIIKEETEQATEAKMKPRFDQIDTKERAAAALPHILTHQATTAKLLFGDLGAGFEKVLKPTGEIDHAEIARLTQENPIVDEIVFSHPDRNPPHVGIAERTEQVAGEMYRIANGLVQFTPANPMHHEIAAFVNREESNMKSLPSDEQLDATGKKSFATAAEWSKMDEAQRARHWHFTEEHLSAIYAAQQAAKAKKLIATEEEKFQNLAKKRGFDKVGEQNRPPNGSANGSPPPTTATPLPPSPAGISAPRMAPTKKLEDNSNIPLKQRLRGIR